jgi:hypothetical protein
MRPGSASIGTSRGVRQRNKEKHHPTYRQSHPSSSKPKPTQSHRSRSDSDSEGIFTKFSNWCSKQFSKLSKTNKNTETTKESNVTVNHPIESKHTNDSDSS